jgi:hypothetical protein
MAGVEGCASFSRENPSATTRRSLKWRINCPTPTSRLPIATNNPMSSIEHILAARDDTGRDRDVGVEGRLVSSSSATVAREVQ